MWAGRFDTFSWLVFFRGGGGILSSLVLRVGWSELHKIWRGHRHIVAAVQVRLMFPKSHSV